MDMGTESAAPRAQLVQRPERVLSRGVGLRPRRKLRPDRRERSEARTPRAYEAVSLARLALTGLGIRLSEDARDLSAARAQADEHVARALAPAWARWWRGALEESQPLRGSIARRLWLRRPGLCGGVADLENRAAHKRR